MLTNLMCRICGNDISDNTELTINDSPCMCLDCYRGYKNNCNCPIEPEDLEAFCSVFPYEIDGYYLYKSVNVSRTNYGGWIMRFGANAVSNWRQSPNQQFSTTYALSEQADEEFRKQYPEQYEEMKKFRIMEFKQHLQELLNSHIIPFINEQRKKREEFDA